nr:cell surface protein [Bifidobacterium sp. DSM 109959]
MKTEPAKHAWKSVRAIASIVASAMMLTSAIPTAYAQTSTGAVVSGSSSGVTVISNGTVVTDNAVVSAAEALKRTTGTHADATAATTRTIEQLSADSQTPFSTKTILDDDNGADSNAGSTDSDQSGDASGANQTPDSSDSTADSGEASGNAGTDTDTANDDSQSSDAASGNADGEQAGDTDSSDADAADGNAADNATNAAATTLGGRDFAGQVTKTINGKTYILIGNEQQLRAIGSDKAVTGGTVYKVQQTLTNTGTSIVPKLEWVDSEAESIAYDGDADLASNQTLHNGTFSDHDGGGILVGDKRTKYFVKDASGNRLDVTDKTYGPNTGLKYTNTENYIIFRDIDLSSNAADAANTNWSPLRFLGTMIGAMSKDTAAGTLWSTLGTDGVSVNDTAARPTISHVTVEQAGPKMNVNEQQGIGFFSSLTSDTNLSGGSLASSGTVTVTNVKLSDVSVTNNASEAYVPPTLLNSLTTAVGLLLDGLLTALKLITFGKVDVDLDLQDLLSLHKDNPSNLATGAFAGRIYGDVKVTNCAVEDVKVSSVGNMTGGFAGYVEGATRYDVVSDIVDALAKLLAKVLNVIPFLGLGDLVTWLLNGTLGLNALVPVGYYNPVISNSTVTNFKEGTTLGSADKPQAGGFVGAQIGAIIENSSVTSQNAFTVLASDYAGGFAGVSRNGNVGGLLNSLGVDLMSALRPQSLIENSTLTATGGVTVTAANYAGGFSGAMANSYAVNDTMTGSTTVTATTSYAGGFTGCASVGWGLELGSGDATNGSLLKQLVKAVTNLLGDGSGASAGELLSVAGVKPSAIVGLSMNGAIAVESKGDYAGGIVGLGSGVTIGDSSETNLNKLSYWKYDTTLHPRRVYPASSTTTVTGLAKVSAAKSYAGGIAGSLQPVMVAGLLNSVLQIGDTNTLKKLGEFATFLVENVEVTGPADGLTVSAGDYYAGGAIGCATGGDVTNVNLTNLASLSATGEVGGFIGFSGPGSAVGATGLNVLDLIKLSGLLSVAQYSSVEVNKSNVTGVASGFTVKATGVTDGDKNRFAAGGFYGQANSTKTRESHVLSLKSVTADKTKSDGVAGGFVGYSTTGGLADAVDNADAGDKDGKTPVLDALVGSNLLSVDDLLGAVPYLIPNYKDATVSYVNGGYVEGDIAGGFAGNFQSGKVNQFTDKELADDTTLATVQTTVTAAGYAAVVNIDHVTGGAYAGGFGGKVVSGALASAGNGGISLLGKLGTVDASSLLQVVQGYVPLISYASVHSDASTVEKISGGDPSDLNNPGLVVSTDRIDATDSTSGSAGGYIGYGSGVQVSHSDVTQLRYTKVTEPKALEGTDGSAYFDAKQSAYAVSAKRYAGGYIGFMDIGSAASVGKGIQLLGKGITLTDVTSVLSVVVSTIEHSDVTGAAAGYAVIASDTSEKNTELSNGIPTAGSADNPLGEAGGFAGRIMGGHIQDSNAHNFAYIIGQITAGGYAGGIAPGDVANVLGNEDSTFTILKGLVSAGGTFASLLQDFVPTIRNSSTDAVPCGGAVRAQAASDKNALRGMAGGYVGHDEGGHIWGMNNAPWKSENDGNNHYTGTLRTASAARIRSVYGAEFAGGYTGFMEAADTAETGSLSLLFGLIEVGNLLGALGVAYPTDENTQVTGPLRNLDYDTWKAWADAVGTRGGYGKEFAELLKIGSRDDLNKAIDTYIYGTNVVAGRTDYDQNANASQGGVAGGYVGLMRSGTVTNGLAQDTKQVKAMRAAGGFAGSMESGGAAKFGTIDVLGLIKVNLSKLVSALNVFVPVVKSSSVIGYRRGMTVEATGTDITHTNGFAGGYVGYASGAQIWGDATFSDADKSDDRWTIGSTHKDYTATGCNVSNLRRVAGTNAVGGYAGLITAAGVAEVNTNASEGILQKLLDAVISTPNDLAQVVQATVSTVRGASVSSVKDEQSAAAWGFTVEGAYTVGGTTKYARAAGGFAGSMKAVVAGSKNGGTSATNTLKVDGLRGVEGGQYAGGFFGQADTTAVASVAGTDGTAGSDQSAKLLLGLIKAGNISALEAFRPYIYHAEVNGVADGIQIRAHDASKQGILDSKRYTGAAGGFGGGLINGTVDFGTVTNLNSVNGVNYAGGFVGHLGKAGTLDVDNAQVSKLLGATAGVLDIWGSHVDDSKVSGITNGFTVAVSHQGEKYAAGTDAATGREVAGGFAGYADLARVSRSTVADLKKVSSGEIAGGFVGETTMAYLVDTEVSSVLLDVILKVVNALLKLLYASQLQNLGVIDLGSWFPAIKDVFDLKVLAEGNVLYVNLFGLKISVGLSKKSTENQQQTDVAIITIGDSTIKLPCTENGVDENQLRTNLKVTLIKGNRTKVTNSSVQGITAGYDVFGGGATQDLDGEETLTTGYAGGFAGLNTEGVLQGDSMTYADTIRGTSGLVDPFAVTTLKSNWKFENKNKIIGPDDDGKYNTYRIYRTHDDAAGDAVTSAADGRELFVAHKVIDTGDGTLNTGLDRWDVEYYNTINAYDSATASSGAAGDNKTTWIGIKDATIKRSPKTGDKDMSTSKAMEAYVSPAKAVLMLNKAVDDNNGGLTPEPDDGQDPCGEDGCQTVDLTLQKVWRDYGSKTRPDAVELTITAHYTDENGNVVTPDEITCYDGGCDSGKPQRNPWTVRLTAKDGASPWTDTWRTKVTGLPVARVDKDANGNDIVRYYTYTVSETAIITHDDDGKDIRKTPADADYVPSVTYGTKRASNANDNKEYVATVTNTFPLPDTGGEGTRMFAMMAFILIGLGVAWYVRDGSGSGTSRRRGRHVSQ